MVKSDIMKYDVTEFVEKVRSKAIKAVREEYDKEINSYVVKKLEDLGLLSQADYALDELLINFNLLNVKAKELGFKANTDYNTHPFPDELIYLKRLKETFKNSYLQSYSDEIVTTLKAEKESRVEKVKSSYNIILDVISRMRSIKKMLEYLKGVGFDISTLEATTETLDKHNLFPCKFKEEKKDE